MTQDRRHFESVRNALKDAKLVEAVTGSVALPASDAFFWNGTRIPRTQPAPRPVVESSKRPAFWTTAPVQVSSEALAAERAARAIWARNCLEESEHAFVVYPDGDFANLSLEGMTEALMAQASLVASLSESADAAIPFRIVRSIEDVVSLQESMMSDGVVSVGTALLTEESEETADPDLEEGIKAQRLKRHSATERSAGRANYRRNKGSVNRARKRLRKTSGFKRRAKKLARLKKGRSAGPRKRFVVAWRDATANLSESITGVRALVESTDAVLNTLWSELLPLQLASTGLAEDVEALVIESEEDDLEKSLGNYSTLLDEYNRKITSGELALPVEAAEAMKTNEYLVLSMANGVIDQVSPAGTDEEAFALADEIFDENEDVDATFVYDAFTNELVYFNSDEIEGESEEEASEDVVESRLTLLRLANDLRESSTTVQQLKSLSQGAIVEEADSKSILTKATALCESACEILIKAFDGSTGERKST